jgi:hypothetical protein
VVKPFVFVLISCLLGIAIGVSSLPRIDLPETAYNEGDATLNVLRPAQHLVQLRAQYLAIMLLRLLYRGTNVVDRLASVSTAPPNTLHRSHLRIFLCELLI